MPLTTLGEVTILKSDRARSDNHAPATHVDSFPRYSHLYSARSTHSIPLFGLEPFVLGDHSVRDQMGAERSRGAACGRIFHDADSREKPPRMRQRRSTDRIQAVAITAFASKRSNQRSKFLRVDLNALQIGEGTKRHEQMPGFACRHHAGCESGHTQHVSLDRKGA